MRLQRIKLAGFKSFVDPTTIELPGNLICIAGPNGCGKSNVVDAVRWVMGEVSAKHLRGGTMADVVFNGSGTRQPVDQASVELIFDNREGRLGGQYASYGEIAIRRQVSRDGQSLYFLNDKRCRRRDVLDIFLGTGLGPRSYAIIEQGMVSRLVEAKPDEIRAFLEEAAGVSKYKERRREAAQRMESARDNLERLGDLRDELAKRLAHLKRQATMAEKYTELKGGERLAKAQHLALRHRALAHRIAHHQRELGEQETALAALVAKQRQTEARLEQERVGHSTASDGFNNDYRAVLEAEAVIARREESIRHLTERRQQLRQTLEKEEAAFTKARDHRRAAEERLTGLQALLAEKSARIRDAEQARATAETRFEASETAMAEWSEAWESLARRAAEAKQAVRLASGQIEHLTERLAGLEARQARLTAEQSELDPAGIEREMAADQAALHKEESALQALERQYTRQRMIVRDARHRVEEIGLALNAAQERQQEHRGKLSSLEALQQSALGRGDQTAKGPTRWLRENGLGEGTRLAEVLKVAPGWERAVERVLGDALGAVCVKELAVSIAALESLGEGTLMLFATGEVTDETAIPPGEAAMFLSGMAMTPGGAAMFSDKAAGGKATMSENKPLDSAPPLTHKVLAPWPLHDLLRGVLTAEDQQTALAIQKRLAPGETVVTPTGEWLGKRWLRVARGQNTQARVLARGRAIKALGTVIAILNREIQDWTQALSSTRQVLAEAEEAENHARTASAETHQRHTHLQSRLSEQQARLAEIQRRETAIAQELSEIRTQQATAREACAKAEADLKQHQAIEAQTGTERAARQADRAAHQTHLGACRTNLAEVREQSHRLGVEIAGISAERDTLTQAGTREEEQIAHIKARCETLGETLADIDSPLGEAEASLARQLTERQALETVLTASRQRVEAMDAAIRDLDQTRHDIAEQSRVSQTALEKQRLALQEYQVRQGALEEQITQAGHTPVALLADLPLEADEKHWEEKIGTLTDQINRLGPINLAAITEYADQNERKGYLDTQHQDLIEALNTLQEAIQDIDRETRSRFADTFEKANTQLGLLFPKLFGGGHAYLERIGSDPLNAGITVMAQPPGKRNSSIQLLSGGEKALTAVAMVFALFELNPAPFCLLDEVDAPLDDANVHRFRDLVKALSEQVQFVIISHNKNTMSLANSLIGITMSEPGVSRLVTVDMETIQ